MTTKPPKNIKAIDKLTQKKLQASLINHITSVYFYFNLDEEEMEEIDMDDYILNQWDNALITAAALGLKVVGQTEDGNIVAELKPVKSVKEFLIEENWGGDDNVYLEDVDDEDVTSTPEDIDWGQFTKVFE